MCVLFRHAVIRLATLLALVPLLAGCALDTEDGLRDYLRGWVFLAQTRHFTSKSECTVAVFDLASDSLRSTAPVQVTEFRQALVYLRQDRAVWFDMPGISPHDISRAVMSLDLPSGLGLLSSGVGPATGCIADPAVSNGFYSVMTSGLSVTLYDPAANALILLYPPEHLLLVLRGS
ncbi:hypothetical protein [Thetidibacter halocola]|uniref:Lipoprotein n=1 Tax=Thetidibacter halocola TaxID=2827239 RepID=A0A8J7WHL8_9RHOB|nr:hypothetical protein [Thetidibacter halocola]MBS0125199.1 hypothetical protein [Thetidibacter halocola]